MNLDFSDDQKQLRDQLRRFLEERSPSSAVRAVLEGEATYDAKLYEGLGEMGVLGAAIPEEYGGVGLGRLELCVLAEELGRAIAPVPVAPSIYLAAEFLLEAGSEVQKAKWLPKLASGEAIGAFAYAEKAGRVTAASIRARAEGGRLTGTKIAVAAGAEADVLVVATRGGGSGLSLHLVEGAAEGVTRRALPTIDPTLAYAEVKFESAVSEPLGAAGQGAEVIARVLDRAAVLVAFEQVGGAERALEMGRDYALDRMAFGRQIGSFQAIKHMLADVYVANTLARSNAYYAAWALSTDSAELPAAAATARVSATQAFQQASKSNIQVHGGMGFTWQFDCHLLYRRANALALSLGAQSEWEDRLVASLRRDNQSRAAA